MYRICSAIFLLFIVLHETAHAEGPLEQFISGTPLPFYEDARARYHERSQQPFQQQGYDLKDSSVSTARSDYTFAPKDSKKIGAASVFNPYDEMKHGANNIDSIDQRLNHTVAGDTVMAAVQAMTDGHLFNATQASMNTGADRQALYMAAEQNLYQQARSMKGGMDLIWTPYQSCVEDKMSTGGGGFLDAGAIAMTKERAVDLCMPRNLVGALGASFSHVRPSGLNAARAAFGARHLDSHLLQNREVAVDETIISSIHDTGPLDWAGGGNNFADDAQRLVLGISLIDYLFNADYDGFAVASGQSRAILANRQGWRKLFQDRSYVIGGFDGDMGDVNRASQKIEIKRNLNTPNPGPLFYLNTLADEAFSRIVNRVYRLCMLSHGLAPDGTRIERHPTAYGAAGATAADGNIAADPGEQADRGFLALEGFVVGEEHIAMLWRLYRQGDLRFQYSTDASQCGGLSTDNSNGPPPLAMASAAYVDPGYMKTIPVWQKQAYYIAWKFARVIFNDTMGNALSTVRRAHNSGAFGKFIHDQAIEMINETANTINFGDERTKNLDELRGTTQDLLAASDAASSRSGGRIGGAYREKDGGAASGAASSFGGGK